NINTHEGGTHEAGFRTALTRAINDYARRSNLFREDDDNLSGEDVREGLTAIVSIKHTDQQFEGQTKTKLGNSDVRTVIYSVFSEAYYKFLFDISVTCNKILVTCLMLTRRSFTELQVN